MLFQLFYLFTALFIVAAPMEAGIVDMISRAFSKDTSPKPPKIRILLAHDESAVFLEVKGKFHIYDPHTLSHINTSYIGKRRTIEATSDGIRWGEEFPGVYQIVIVPDSKETTSIVGGVEYRGKVFIYDVGGNISIVNEIDVEEYLSSVLPERYPTILPEAVLEAIAITARTDTCYLAKSAVNPYWDIDASKVGYHGYGPTRPSKLLASAIQVTQDICLHRIGQAEWVAAPFAVSWKSSGDVKKDKNVTYSAITIEEAVNLANKGATAVQILEQAFPNTAIQKIEYAAA